MGRKRAWSGADGASGEVLRFGNWPTPKIPPAFHGRGSWFAHEEAIDGWLVTTTLDGE